MAVFLLLSGCDAWTSARGTIRDATGKPVAGATITLQSEHDSLTGRSDQDGHYLVSIWQPPSKIDYKLSVTKPGFAPFEKQLRGPQAYRDLDVVLRAVPTDSGSMRESPEALARATFPDASEKTKTSDCFRDLKSDVSVKMVVDKCGRPDEELGSGFYIFVWHLADRSTVTLETPYLERIYRLGVTDKAGKRTFLVGSETR